MKITDVSACSVVLACSLFVGCGPQLQYQAFSQIKADPTPTATIFHGNLGSIPNMTERANLPHSSTIERIRMRNDALHEITKQIGSPDYVVLGGISGTGNNGDS
ncbi:MAG TPA: hypothetical protein VG711_08655, partial [Phycisphaerales bacterium]|nr:hypothetical protein [Phycisphaerales bacterium]